MIAASGRIAGDGVSLAYRYWEGAGAPIVAIHGLTAHHLNFVGLAERLAGRRPLWAVDLRGRGDSDKPEGPYGIETHARDVAAAMKASGLGPSIVIGHSMGAYIATALAARFPESVRGLVLVDGGYPPEVPGLDPAVVFDLVLRPIVARLRRRHANRDAHRQFWRSQALLTIPEWGPWMDAYVDYGAELRDGEVVEKASEAATVVDFAELTRREEIAPRLGALRVPVLLVRAGQGMMRNLPPVVGDEVVARIRQLVPQLEDVVVPEVTHYTILLAEPGVSAVTHALVSFADRIERNGGLAVPAASLATRAAVPVVDGVARP